MKFIVYYLFWIFTIIFLSCSCNNDKKVETNNVSNKDTITKNKDVHIKIPKEELKKISDMEPQKPITYKIEVINKFPHNTSSYTQGLFWLNGYLYEGIGQYGSSGILKTELNTGKILKSYYNLPNIFGEGIAFYKNKIYQLSWQNEKGFIYDLNSFEKLDEFNYKGEGWGLTNYENNLIMSDGSNLLKIIEPEEFKVIKIIPVKNENDLPVYNLNELENIEGEIWANIYMTDLIAIINPQTGKTRAYIDCYPLKKHLSKNMKYDVLNGIAYDKDKKRIFVTGKLWEYIFEIRLLEK